MQTGEVGGGGHDFSQFFVNVLCSESLSIRIKIYMEEIIIVKTTEQLFILQSTKKA